MISNIKAFPTTDGIFVVWNVTEMIPNCLGFALYRREKGKAATVVNTWVGFEDQEQVHKQGEHRPSTEWPIQKTSWTDFMAPAQSPVSYGVAPVLKDGDKGLKLAANSPDRWTDYVSAHHPTPWRPGSIAEPSRRSGCHVRSAAIQNRRRRWRRRLRRRATRSEIF
jgi:hypothetical protein